MTVCEWIERSSVRRIMEGRDDVFDSSEDGVVGRGEWHVDLGGAPGQGIEDELLNMICRGSSRKK